MPHYQCTQSLFQDKLYFFPASALIISLFAKWSGVASLLDYDDIKVFLFQMEKTNGIDSLAFQPSQAPLVGGLSFTKGEEEE